jgi:hypothetical protein
MQLAPHMGIPAVRARSASRLDNGGERSPSTKPDAKMTAARAPTAIASASVASSRSLRTDNTARSGGPGKSARLGTHGYDSIDR